MTEIEFVFALLVQVAALVRVAGAIRIPYPILVVAGGLAMGFVPGLPEIELEPDVIFLVFLPPLLYSAAFFSSPRELRANIGPISRLAVGLVLVTIVVVALASRLLLDLPWAVAFVLGAILAPTDPVAAVAVFRRLACPSGLRQSSRARASSTTAPGSWLSAWPLGRSGALSRWGRPPSSSSWCQPAGWPSDWRLAGWSPTCAAAWTIRRSKSRSR